MTTPTIAPIYSCLPIGHPFRPFLYRQPRWMQPEDIAVDGDKYILLFRGDAGAGHQPSDRVFAFGAALKYHKADARAMAISTHVAPGISKLIVVLTDVAAHSEQLMLPQPLDHSVLDNESPQVIDVEVVKKETVRPLFGAHIYPDL